ncbi:response regulator transcription factor [Arachnia propionica]|uniref:LuxR C-terminal-related transcriptional regulator n=1 Tax=Arachnia propionica TaxID=1750 RepID=UPI0021AD9450|nr:response regulator transcription factor [Arachnia propionica]
MKAGASGYLLKDAGLPALAAGIRQAVRGDMPLSTAVRRQLVASLASTRSPVEAVDLGLTEREREVLVHLTRGMTNQQISGQMYLCERSVKQCLKDIGGKLGVTSRTQILVRAIQLGIVDPHAVPLVDPRR